MKLWAVLIWGGNEYIFIVVLREMVALSWMGVFLFKFESTRWSMSMDVEMDYIVEFFLATQHLNILWNWGKHTPLWVALPLTLEVNESSRSHSRNQNSPCLLPAGTQAHDLHEAKSMILTKTMNLERLFNITEELKNNSWQHEKCRPALWSENLSSMAFTDHRCLAFLGFSHFRIWF